MDDDPLEQIKVRRLRARNAEQAAAEARHAIGRLGARERVVQLLDERDSFLEWGPQTGDDDSTSRGDGVLVGLGRVNGKSSVVISYDVTVHGGREGLNSHAKVQRAIDVADQLNVPVFLLVEGGDLRVDEIPLYEERHNYIVDFARLSGRVPLVGIAFGPVYGMRALLLSTCDAVFATRGALIDLTDPAPPVLSTDADLALLQQRSGMLDLVFGSDDEAIAAARSYAGLLTRALVPFDEPDEPEVAQQLRSIVPSNPRRAFNAERLVELIADRGTAMMLHARYGSAMVTAIARIGGRAVGFAANHPMHVAGAIDSPASDKLTRFIRICDTFGLPLIYLIDTPGLLAGPNGERSAMARHSTRPYFALHDLRVAIFTVTVRRAFGQGAPVMASGGGLHRPLVNVSWPTAQRGGMGLGGAAAITSSSSAAQQAGETRSQQEIERDFVAHGNAWSVALRFETDDVIDPGETRAILRAAVAHAPFYDVRQPRWPIDAW